ncbi:MAG: glycerol-3-phosphate acyltransferase [Bellilinea sp.]
MLLIALFSAYLLGSIPTALLVGRKLGGIDIRTVGDGNMGAHNLKAQFGWRAGIIVAAIDFSKGALAVAIAQLLSLELAGQLLALAFAVLGHDFPIFAGLHGGQGLATTLGGLLMLANFEMLVGLIIYGVVYLITRNSDLGAGIGTGTAVLLMWLRGQPLLLVLGAVVVILIIPAKFMLDRPRRVQIHSKVYK